MLNPDEYLRDGRVMKEQIALDIRFRKLTGKRLKAVLEQEEIQDAFFGSSYYGKVEKKDWTTDYLEQLSYAAVAQSFNTDYLLYLDQVAGHVAHKRTSRKFGYAMATITAIVVCAIAIQKFFLDDGE